MPGGDRTGPNGQGPKTGRGLGYCTGNTQPGYSQPPQMGLGRGYGRGNNRGRGFGRGFFRGQFSPPASLSQESIPQNKNAQEEAEYLQQQLSSLESEIAHIKQRLAELVSSNKD